MSSVECKLGMNAEARFGTPDTDPTTVDISALTVMGNVSDVTLTLEKGKADTTTRENQGWEGTTGTLKKGSASFEMQCKTGDAGLAAIREAYLEDKTIPMAFLDDKLANAGAEGPLATWSVTDFTRLEKLRETIKYSVTVEVTTFIEWHTTAGV